jgi:hypothetical protein
VSLRGFERLTKKFSTNAFLDASGMITEEKQEKCGPIVDGSASEVNLKIVKFCIPKSLQLLCKFLRGTFRDRGLEQASGLGLRRK